MLILGTLWGDNMAKNRSNLYQASFLVAIFCLKARQGIARTGNFHVIPIIKKNDRKIRGGKQICWK